MNCGAPPDPANGSVSHTAGTTYQHTATYSCNTGYNLTGNSTHTCQANGMWSGSAPTCPRMLKLSTDYQVTLLLLHNVFLLQQLWTVALYLTQPTAVLVTLLEQHLDRQPTTVVIVATS